MKKSELILCLAAALLCCGCMPNTQLEERAIVQAAGVDFADGEYHLTLQIFDPGGTTENAGGSDAYLLTEGRGTSLTQATAQAAQSGKEIYLGSCQVLILGTGTTQNLRDVLDYFNSRPQTRATMMVCSAKSMAADVLKIADGKAKPSPAVLCEQELRLAEEEKRLPACRLLDLLSALETEGWDGVLPLLEVEGTGSDAKPVLQGVLVLQNNTSALELNTNEAQLLGMTGSGRGNVMLEVKIDQGTAASVLLEDFDTKLSAQLKNGQPHLTVEMKMKGRVSQWEGRAVDDLNHKQLTAAQQRAAQQMTEEMNSLLQRLCTAGCDPLRFGERLQRRHSKDWNSLGGQNWPNILQKAEWNIEVSCALTTFSGH